MASRVIDALRSEIGTPPNDEDLTADVPLPGTPSGGAASFADERARALRAAGVDTATTARLCWLYGIQLDHLLALGSQDPSWLEPLGPGVPALRGEVKLAVETEMASTLADFMDRRAALLLFSPDFGRPGAAEAAAIMGDLLGWSEERRAEELAAYERLATAHGVPCDAVS